MGKFSLRIVCPNHIHWAIELFEIFILNIKHDDLFNHSAIFYHTGFFVHNFERRKEELKKSPKPALSILSFPNMDSLIGLSNVDTLTHRQKKLTTLLLKQPQDIYKAFLINTPHSDQQFTRS